MYAYCSQFRPELRYEGQRDVEYEHGRLDRGKLRRDYAFLSPGVALK